MNAVFVDFGSGAKSVEGCAQEGRNVKSTSVSDVAILLNYARKVICVHGYGLAVAQAQHAIHEMETILEEKGVEVKYAIHPVAGRMPGHMNVLLAEANVAYEELSEMEEENPEFPTTAVVLVVGANDVVNPAAKSAPSSPIFGMPVLNLEEARNVIVVKRSMNTGYAGIDNELFGYDNCSMLFADAKTAITQVVSELTNL